MGGSLGTKNTPVSPHYPIPNFTQQPLLNGLPLFLSRPPVIIIPF